MLEPCLPLNLLRLFNYQKVLMIYFLHGLLALTAFLIVLNGFLRGMYKGKIDVFLSVILVGIVAEFFVAYNWTDGVIAIVLSFAYATLFRPVAARLSARLLSGSNDHSNQYIGLPPQEIINISRDLGPDPNFDPSNFDHVMNLMQSGSSQQTETALVALHDYCNRNPDVHKVMAEFNVTRESLIEIYNELVKAGAGQWAGGHYVPVSALAYPNTLRYLLEHPENGKDSMLHKAASLVMYFEAGSSLV